MSVVLITGCSSGFGKLAAVEFGRRGDKVFASMRNIAKAPGLLDAAKAAGTALQVIELDVNDSTSISKAVDQVEKTAGPIDILVNNAGIGAHGPVEDFDDDEVLDIFNTNVFGVVRVTRAVLPSMRKRKSGTIVTVGSIAGKVAAPFGGVYAASKHAVEALSDALYFELHPFGIRVALVEPGGFETEIQNNHLTARRFNEASAYVELERRFADASVKLPGAGERADAQVVANAIVDAAKAEQPKRRYLVGKDAELVGGLHKQLSDDDFEKAMRTTLDFWE